MDFGTLRNFATSITVKISPSRAEVPSNWLTVVVDPSLFMALEVSVERFQNLSRCYTQIVDLEADSSSLHVDG